MTKIDRRALFASGSAAALLAAAGVSAAPAPKRGGQLRAALSGGDRSETWRTLPGGIFLKAARSAVFDTLTEIAADGTLQPGLATGWTSEGTGLTWHFDITPDAEFHSGDRLTAKDVAASLNAAGFMAQPTSTGVSLVLKTADPALPFKLAQEGVAIFRAAELETGELRSGTGLYRIKRFEAGRSFIGERIAHHRKDGLAGWADSIELIAVSDEHVRAEAVRDGYVDVADVTTVHEGVKTLFEGAQPVAAIGPNLYHGQKRGTAPLDDMRFAERWWLHI